MSIKPLSPHELRVWHAFKLMGEDVMGRVGRDIAEATGLSGPDFGVLSRLAGLGNGEMRQQRLAECMGWDKSRLSHQLTRMQERDLIERREGDKRVVLVALTEHGREKLKAARPVHAASVRRNLLDRLSAEQIETIVRVSNILGEDD
jgi:DNA-binding MarR family transcriptional regulator